MSLPSRDGFATRGVLLRRDDRSCVVQGFLCPRQCSCDGVSSADHQRRGRRTTAGRNDSSARPAKRIWRMRSPSCAHSGCSVAIDQQHGLLVADARMGEARLTPSAGTRVSVGTVVTITPSGLGPRGSPAVLKSHPRSRVPSFVGRTAATAIGWANSHHMFWSIPRLPALPASHAPTLFEPPTA